MKNKHIFLFSALTLFFALTFIFSSCKKCETCTPYAIKNGVLDTVPDPKAQALTLCDKVDIKTYESLTTFKDGNEDSVRFICK